MLEGAFLSALVVLVFWSPLHGNLGLGDFTDFRFHTGLAAEQMRTGALNTGYFLFHWMVIAASFVTPTLEQAGIYVVLASRVLTGLIVLWFFALKPGDIRSMLAVCTLVVGAMIVTPITVFTTTAHNTYFGYIAINTHHNPTTEVLRPLALASFIALGTWLSDERRRSALWLFGGLTALSVIAKPSYALCLYPALLLFLLPGTHRIRRGAALAAALLPTVIVQVVQFNMYYGQGSDSRIEFAPFALLNDPLPVLAAKLAASIAFPATVTWLFPREARSDTHLKFAWRLALAGLLLQLVLAETGPRLLHGNFGWSSQIALFVLFVAALRVWARVLWRAEPADAATTRGLVAGALVLGLHLASGIIFLSLYWRGVGGLGWY